MAYYIGIDVGTSSVKAALLRDGKTRTYRALYDEALGNTPEGWWKAVCDAVAQVAAAEGGIPGDHGVCSVRERSGKRRILAGTAREGKRVPRD